MRHGNIHFAPAIKKARASLNAAQSGFRRAVREAQAACTHTNSLAREWSSGYCFHHDAVRICVLCGYEEQCSYWSVHLNWPSGGMTMAAGECLPSSEAYSFRTKFPKHGFIQSASSDECFRCRP